MRIGIHTSSAGSLEKTALRAFELGANTFQIFSASPRMWRASPPSAADARAMLEVRARYDLAPLVVHDNYLINLAAADPAIRRKSIAAFRGELERAIAIGAEYLVAHPGSYKDQDLESGIHTLAASLAKAARGIQSTKLTLLLENTAGQGATIGSRLEELREIREQAAPLVEFEIGYCLDTCHLLAAGFDVASTKGLAATVRHAEEVLGLARVPVIHTNDSKTPLGSHRDRHENIGKGYIGLEGFRRIVNHPKLRSKAFILETPINKPGDDRRNLDKLKSLCRKSRTIPKRSK